MTGGMGIFARWQSRYAEHGIATFPVSEGKKPLIRHWSHIGLKGSAELAGKFANESALAFVCGKPSGVTIVDIDTDDEQGVKEARQGLRPIAVDLPHWQRPLRHRLPLQRREAAYPPDRGLADRHSRRRLRHRAAELR